MKSTKPHDEAREILRTCADVLGRDVDIAGDSELPQLADRTRPFGELAKAELTKPNEPSSN